MQRGIGDATNYTMLPVPVSKSTSINVNAASGNLLVQSTDLTIPSKAMPFNVARTFNSLAPSQPGYGSGWTDNNTPYIQVGPDGSSGRNGSVLYTDATGNHEGEFAGTHYYEPSKWWNSFKNFVQAINRTTGAMHKLPEIWLTEQGVLYEEGSKEKPAGGNGNIAQDTMRAYVEDGEHQLTRESKQINRFFYYEMRGAHVFDSGLLSLAGSPRAIYGIYKKKTLGD